MATIFSREEKAEALFGEILKNPEACHRLMDTFNDSLDMADVLDAPLALARSSKPSSSPFCPTLPHTAMTSQLL